MTENTRLSSSIGQIDLELVECEATPRLLIRLSIQLHLARHPLSNTVRVLEMFGGERPWSTDHNWVHKTDLQPNSCRSLDHVAIDETVIRLGDEQYWRYTAVDPELNELPQTKLGPTRNKVITSAFFTELREKHDVKDAVLLVDGDKSLNYACQQSLDFRYERHGNRNSVERVFRAIKRRTSSLSNCVSNAYAETADQWFRSFTFAWNQLI